MTGFSGLNSDNTKHSAIGQRICMYDDVPTDGTTPEDHDLISNVRYAAEKLYTAKYFRGYTSGKVEAELGAGLSYTQYVYNTRVVKGDKIFTESISSSWAKSVGEQKYIDGTKVLFRPSVKVDGSTAKFADSVKDISKEYGTLYGLIPNELTKQVLSVTVDPEKPYGVTIKSVSDDNAPKSKPAAQTADDDEHDGPYEAIDFYNPQSLTPGSDGNFKVTLHLDPVSATLYSRNETRTLAGSSQNPDYSSASNGSVVVTIVIDKNWYPVSVNVRETYGIEIPGIGALICNSNLTETFSDLGNKDIVLPEQEFFETHMPTVGETPATAPEAADYLMYAFGKYLSGEQNLDLSANVSIGNVDIKNVKLSVNIGTMNVRAKYDDLYLEYAKGDAVGLPDDDLVYITLNDIKGYLPIAKATGLIDDPAVKTLMSLFTSDIALPDFGSLLGDDFMSGMSCEATDKYVYINIPLELDGLAKIDAKMTLKNNETYDLVGITGTVDAFGKTIDVNIKTAKNLEFETPDKSYVDLSPVVDFVPTAISTVLNNTAYGISGNINANGTEVALDAYIERDEFKTVAVDGAVSIFGADVSLQYVNDALYLAIGNIGVKANSADIPALINEITEYVGTDASTLDKVKALLPQTIGDWISTLKSLTVDEHEIVIGMRILGAPITVTLSRDGDMLTGLTFKCNVDVLGIKFDCDVAIDITVPEHRDIAVKAIEYVDAKEITALIPCILDYASAKAFDAQINGKITIDGVAVLLDGLRLGVDLSDGTAISAIGRVTALDQSLDVAYVGETAYIAIGNIKLKLAASDLDAFAPHINRLLEALGIELPSVGSADTETIAAIIPTILNAVESVTLENKTLVLKAALGDGNIVITADIANGKLEITGKLGNIDLALKGALKTVSPEELDITVEAPEAYGDAAEFVPTIEALADIIEARAVSTGFDVRYGDLTVGGTLAIDLNGVFKFNLNIDRLVGKDLPNVTLDLTVIDKTAYIKVGGNVNIALAASTSDLGALLESLKAVIPSELFKTIEKVLNDLADPESAINEIIANSDKPDIESIRSTLDKVLSAVTLNIVESNIDFGITLDDVALTANVKTDLKSAQLDTAFGSTELSARLYGISSGAAISIPDADFISIAEFIPIIEAVIPVATAEGYLFDVDVVLFGVNVSGTIAISLPTEAQKLAVNATAMIGDVPLNVTYKDDVVYLNVNNGEIMLKCGTTTAELNALLEELAKAIPALKDVLDGLSSGTNDGFTLADLVNAKLTLAHTENGFAASIDLTPAGVDATAVIGFGLTDGKLSGITFDVTALTSDDDSDNDIAIDIDLTVELDEAGALRAIRTIEGAQYKVVFEIASLAAQTVNVGSADGYISVADLTDFIAPIAKLLDNINSVKSLTFGIDAYVLTEDMQRLSISGMIEIDLDTTAIRVSLDMLGEKIYITYVSNVLYIKLGTVQLKFTLSDDIEKSDIARIYAILDEYLPRYLSEELAVLLGITDGETSSLSDTGLIIDRFTAMASAETITEKAALLFGKLHDYEGASSAIKTLADMINLYMRNGTPTVGIALSQDIVIDITPYLTADKSELAEISVDTAVAGMTVHASIGTPTLKDSALGIAAPEKSDDYVSIVDYVELINNIVHTFTTTDENGDITFLIDTFDFTYKENDTTVVKEDGTTETTAGKTITVESVIGDDGAALPVLKGVFKNNGSGYDVNLEAHLTLDGIFEYTGKITIAVYVLTNYVDEATGELYDKVAFLSYKENGTGYGENVSIDYGSVMQILASVLKILGVNDTTVNRIIPAEYRVDINSDVFNYMDIVGMASVRESIDNLV